MEDPNQCTTMAELRAVIDRLDADLIQLLRQRSDCIDRAIVLKQAEDLPARIPSRVEEVVAKVRAHAVATGLDPALAEMLWRSMIEWSIAREEVVLGSDTKVDE
ncbi:MAG: chorismate mutase [Pseudomonadota bacterium]